MLRTDQTTICEPGSFEHNAHYYPRVLNAQIHPLARFFLTLALRLAGPVVRVRRVGAVPEQEIGADRQGDRGEGENYPMVRHDRIFRPLPLPPEVDSLLIVLESKLMTVWPVEPWPSM